VTIKKFGTAATIMTLAIFALAWSAIPALATYSLVWSDEFDGTTLNAANWTADVGNGCPSLCGWGNNELEYYRTQNVSVSGGNLVLTTLRQSYGGSSFTSGKVHTRGKQSFLYGRIEMRAKIPTGDGMWPAFWMMPAADVYGGWAASGEIDIMESSNSTTSVGGALHFGGSYPNNTSTSSSYSLGGPNFADAFHVYAVEWEPDAIRWYVDGVLFATRVSSQWYSDGAPGNPRAPFDQEFYIILNAAVGGWYTGCVSPSCVTATFPQQYLIDYVRVYEDIDNFAPVVAITSPIDASTVPAGNLTIDATATDEDGTVVKVEFYNGGALLGEDTTAPYSFTWNSVADGCYNISAKAIDDLGGTATAAVDITVGAGCGQAPFLGSPFVLPTIIQAEDFDIGGEGIAYHDAAASNNGGAYRPGEGVDIEACSDAGGGYDVGWISNGEWMEYTVDVPVAGTYIFEARVASLATGGVFHINFNGLDVTGDIVAPVTTGWQTWATVSGTATLEAGLQVMRFVPTTTGFNVNYFEFINETSAVIPGVQPLGYELYPCYPNPFNPQTTISYDLPLSDSVTLVIYDIAGKLVKTLVHAETVGAGRHEVVWDGRDETGRASPAGVYFYQLDAGDYSRTRRMTLVK